ncbi:BZ3500_MvSof-1268-A1-R1_Chr4-2g07030 [Microbotryum saponariae]|uniref:BZ3500_MvSof-1268-A1-R1_Chr4-2g07030 protein n=1 Tax=Microbotryum saponariae TaxID=289078 RepID=A0A2X0MBV5_9BASI|nr:BZ3500_MvSof-1268-A1-R1_Chr4-2g07030 [Microbotryum saponariae]SDA06695.1 BZ3501_MvSof-1269-A2-R1_Chr4-2g06741 [Microbotryum saponariae]
MAPPSSAIPSAARLSSLATSTLSQILELTRAAQLSLPSTSLSSTISKNLSQLYRGIELLDGQDSESPQVMTELKSQYQRLIKLVEPLGVEVEFDGQKGKGKSKGKGKNKTGSKTGKLVDAGDDGSDEPFGLGDDGDSDDEGSDDQGDDDDDDDGALSPNQSGVALHTLSSATNPHVAIKFPPNPESELEQMEEDEETLRRANAEVVQMQKRMIEDQDETLNSLSSAIARQHSLSQHISSELEQQSGLLDETDSAIDRTQIGLRRASGRLNQFTRKAKETGSTGLIIALVVLLLILIVAFKL